MDLDNMNIIKSAVKIFDILELVTEENKITLTSASEKSGYTKSTVQRILNTLKYLDYIEQDKDSLEYFPTFKLYTLGNQVLIADTIKTSGKFHMKEMSKEINETINLGILDNDKIIYLHKVLSRSPLRVDISHNMNIPLYSSALGKAIVAFTDNNFEFQDNYEPFTKNTISSDLELKEELKNIRKLGYALDNEEFIEGLICIGVPILDKNKVAIASLSLSIPAIRFKKDELESYVTLLYKYAHRIEKDIFKNRKDEKN